MRRALTTSELRRTKIDRHEFLLRPRRPITVVLDGVTQNYNIGAIFRLCDAFLVQQLVICGAKVNLHKRKLVQAAQGTQHWVPWSERRYASETIAEAKVRGAWVIVAEQTTASVPLPFCCTGFHCALTTQREEGYFPAINFAGTPAHCDYESMGFKLLRSERIALRHSATLTLSGRFSNSTKFAITLHD